MSKSGNGLVSQRDDLLLHEPKPRGLTTKEIKMGDKDMKFDDITEPKSTGCNNKTLPSIKSCKFTYPMFLTILCHFEQWN